MLRSCCFNARAVALLLLPQTLWAIDPKISNSSETTNGELMSVTAWHAQTPTNITWDIPASNQSSNHVIVIAWDEEATDMWLFGVDNISSRAHSQPESTSAASFYWPVADAAVFDATCNLRDDAFNSTSKDAFHDKENWAPASVDLADETAWWYLASLSQDAPTATTLTSGEGNVSVMLTEPGLYSICLLIGNQTCAVEECANFTVYQPPYDFLEIKSTNLGEIVSVRFNLVTRHAYSGDWGWILGGVDPSVTLEDANSLTASQAENMYDERCWFYIGRAIELEAPFLCSPDPDAVLEASQSTPTFRSYQFGWFELYISDAGDGSFWFAKHDQFIYAMVSHFYTCGITVQPLNATGVETTSDLVVTAVPEQGPTCDVGRGIALQ